MAIVGTFSSGKTSQTLEAVLKSGGADRLTVVSEESGKTLAEANQFEVTISSRLGNTSRRLEFSSGAVFSTKDNDAIDELVRSRRGIDFSTVLHKIESHLGLVAASTVLSVAIIWWTLNWGVPALARQVAFQLPESVLESVGAGSIELLDRLVFEPSRLSVQEISRLRSMMNPILESVSSTPLIEFRSGVGPNAFALPNGTIVFTDELIEMADSDEEILAVLYHEMGHLSHRHLLRRTLQDSLVTLAIISITGDVESANIFVGLPTLFFDLQYSRAFETEADRFALESMNAEGIDLTNFELIMNKLDAVTASDAVESLESTIGTRLSNYLSSHPSTPERIALISEFRN